MVDIYWSIIIWLKEQLLCRPNPLALYIFSTQSKVIQSFLQKTNTGGVSVNDALYHLSSKFYCGRCFNYNYSILMFADIFTSCRCPVWRMQWKWPRQALYIIIIPYNFLISYMISMIDWIFHFQVNIMANSVLIPWPVNALLFIEVFPYWRISSTINFVILHTTLWSTKC